MKKLLWLAIAVTAGCAAPKVAEEDKEEAAPSSIEMATVQVRDVHDTLAVDGTFTRPEGTSSRLAPVTAGRVSEVLVKEGDHVSVGQVLARIDSAAVAAQAQSADSASAAAAAGASQSELTLRAAEADYAAAVKASALAVEIAKAEGRANVDAARSDLQRLLAGARPQELAQAEQSVEQAVIARDKARADAERDRRLLAEGLVAGSQADASAATARTAQSAVQSAQAALDLLRAGARTEEIRAARERFASAFELAGRRTAAAEAALAQARTGALSVRARAKEAAAARLAAAGKMADARAAGAVAESGKILSPLSGVVVRRFLNPGDVADPTTPILAVATAAPTVDFVGTVSPTEAATLSVGMAAICPGMTGRVTSIGEADPQTGMGTVRIHLSGNATSGSFATVRVVRSTLRAARLVPKGALLSREGKAAVFVVKDGVAHQTPVVVGPEENGWVAIRQGVASGSKVAVLGSHELADGAKVEAAERP